MKRLGKICINDLVVRTIIGDYEWERKQEQEIIVNIEIETDVSNAVASDGIQDTVNYVTVAQLATSVIRETKPALIETAAEKVAEAIVEQFPIESVRVRIEKPHAVPFSS